MLALSYAGTASFLSVGAPAPVNFGTRASTPLMKKGMSRKERKAASSAPAAGEVTGVVVPTNLAAEETYDAGVLPDSAAAATPAETVVSTPVPSQEEENSTGSKLPPIAGSTKAAYAEAKAGAAGRAQWNPQGLDISTVPGPIQSQFVPGYLKAAPAYLDGALAGDMGFDPWAVVALASPTAATDKFARSAADRDAKMLSMTAEEQKQALAWMRESEIKHARLAMLGAAGWPMAELNAGEYLKPLTGGRCPSLFNGHLLDFLPALLVVFGPIAYLEFQNKDKLPEGDWGFDPLGLAGDQRPYGAFPFDAFLGKKTPIDAVRYAKDLEAMKLAELKNGRLAMMAITGMAVQETVWGTPVVEQTPFFFGR